MENSKQTSPNTKAFEILGGIFNTQIVVALSQANIIETLGQDFKSLDEIATSCNVHKNVLFRTLRYATFLGIVNLSNGKYSLTDTGKFFLKDTPGSLFGSMSFVSAPPWRDSWNNFLHCLRTGDPAFNYTFGMPFFDYLDKNPQYGRPFNHYQTMMTTQVASLVSEVYDFSVFKTVCDVGGGQGLVLKSILQKYPSCKGILFDIESVLSENVLAETSNRTQLNAGNFFDSIPTADCMVLKTVIHDWNEVDSTKILTNCRNSLNKGGKIILIEQVVEEPQTLTALFYDLHMQVMLGGAERTEEEFRSIFSLAGLKLERIIPTKSPFKLIEVSIND